MLKQRHQHLHAAATTCNSTSLAAGADCRSSGSTCSSQQAAAAWAWFQHGGSSCITPSKAEGLVAAKRRSKHISSGPSRFKIEVLISTRKIPHHGAADPDDHAIRRCHSFHNDLTDRTSYIYRRFSTSCRSAPGSPCFDFDDSPIHDQNEAENKEGGNILCQDEASSLLDKFEIEAVCRQLHDQLSCMTGRSPSCSKSLSSTCRAEPPEYHESRQAHLDHPQAHLKPCRYFESSNAAAHKPLADNEHHHNIHDVVHRLLHSRIKTLWSRSSMSAAPAVPLYCSSIATANCIVDHHRHSPKQLGTVSRINQTAKRQAVLCDQGVRQNVGRVRNYSGELIKLNQVSSIADEGSAAADEHERGEFTARHHKSQQKVRRRRDYELTGAGALTMRITSLHQSDSKYSKALQRLESRRLAHMSPLLGHHMAQEAGQKSWRDDGVLVSKNCDRHFHKHHHIHHHHHHYHHLQQRNQASQRLLRDLKGDGANVVQATKLYRQAP